jgi:TolB-like protein/predicted Ser/Thr protein kinase
VTRDEARVAKLAEAILDGTPVDWSVEETEPDESRPPLLKHLKVVAAVAEVHRIDTSAASSVAAVGQWGHLRLLERIGRGAFGEVYRAWDTRLDREVALKLLPADRASADSRPSIIHEGRLLARVRHPNVVTIHGAEQIDDRIGLWMEFVRGRTLEQVIEEGTAFSTAEATRIGIEICRAVSAVHGAGLLHRDIKAHNVMLADDGRVVLMDFGTGRELEDRAAADLAGTPLYLAPEIFRGQPATIQSDIYSLGVLLFHLASGSYPVQARTTRDLRRAHERNERVGLQSIRPDAPPSLIRVIDRAIDPVPERRYQNADALAADLVALTRRSGRRSVMYAALAAAAVLIVAWLALTTGRQRVDATLAARQPVVAVLPFENLSKEAESEEFADGLTYEIHRNLASIEGLELRSATSSFMFKNKQRDLADIDKQLDVDYVLEGTIFKAGSKISVSPRLTRVAGDTTVWANTFDRELRDVFAIRDEISLAIVNALRLKLGSGQRRYETEPDVYYQFLKARGLRSRRSAENALKAAAIFEAVVARDPGFAPAWAGLASAAADATRHAAPREEMPPLDPRMEPAALTAIRIDPLLAEAHAALGSVYGRNRDWTNAERSFLEALKRNPSLTTTHTDFVLSTLLPMGKVTEALHLLEEAQRLDPLSLDVRRVLALVQVDAEQYADAIESSRWVLARDPEFPYAKLWLGRALILSGKPNEALSIFENSAGGWGYLGYLYAVTGRREEAEALAAQHPDSPRHQMLIYSGLGDKDRAFEALERLASTNWWRAATWMDRPEMMVLRGDPRVADLRRRLGLPPLEDRR